MKTPNLNLYIVDDDKDVRDSLAALFIARGYRLQAFESGESFLANADIQSCGCLILDLDMDSGMGGQRVFEEMKKLGSTLDSKIFPICVAVQGGVGKANSSESRKATM